MRPATPPGTYDFEDGLYNYEEEPTYMVPAPPVPSPRPPMAVNTHRMGGMSYNSTNGDTGGDNTPHHGAPAKPKRKAGRPILCDKDPNSADLTEEQRRVLKRYIMLCGAV